MSPEGALFIGELAGSPAYVWRLSARAIEPTRRRLLASGEVPLAVDLDADPAWIALEQPRGTVASHPPRDEDAAYGAILDLTRALAAAHARGLVHGSVSASSAWLDAHGHVSLSFLGLGVERALVHAPEHDERAPRPTGDLFGLGWLIRELSPVLEGWREPLLAWADRLCDRDPAARPSAIELLGALGDETRVAAAEQLGDALAPGVFEAVAHGERRIVCVGPHARFAMERLAWVRHPALPPSAGTGVSRPRGSPCDRLSVLQLAYVASALEVAHAVGVAHGQLTPRLVFADGDAVQLVGFGAATEAAPDADLAAIRALAPATVDLSRATTMEEAARALFAAAGRPTSEPAEHPRPPVSARAPITNRFEWSLRAAPSALWPWVANTERINHALGLAAVEQRVEQSVDGPRVHGHSSQVGLPLDWIERPHEWLIGRRLGVVREYAKGPLAWLRSTVELRARDGGGTTLVHTLEAEPHNVLARAVAAIELGVRMRRALERVYLRIDAVLAGELEGRGALSADAFEEAPAVGGHALTEAEARAVEAGADPQAIRVLGDLIRYAPAQELARMQPIAIARRFELDEALVVDACLIATEARLLSAGWDLLCPGCRVPSGYAEALAELQAHGRCEVCAIDYALDLSERLELVFQPHPSLRAADHGTYCLSSPAHTPHVLAQMTLAPKERLRLQTSLSAGAWQLARVGAEPIAIEVADAAELPWKAEIALHRPPDRVRLASGAQSLVIENDGDQPARVRIESAARRLDVLTGARAVAHPLFPRCFPGARIAKDVTLEASSMALLATDEGVLSFDDAGEALLHAISLAEVDRASGLELGKVSATGPIAYAGPALDGALACFGEGRAREIVLGPSAAADPVILELTWALEAEGRIVLAGAAGATGTRLRAQVR